jgi:hypothetical protein
MKLYSDFIEFIKLLQKHEVEYLIVGGYALSIHSQPRTTKDLDIWINPTKENAEKMLNVLTDFGFESLEFTEEDFLNEDRINQLGNPPVRIDILNNIDGLNFDDAYKNKYVNSLGKAENIFFISVKDLIKNKSVSGRIKDKADIDWIKRYGKKS